MSLWVDKHRPKSLNELDYDDQLTRRLKALASSGDFPHLLMYGPSGAGKKTRVMAVLRQLYGPRTEKIKIDPRMFQAGSRKVEFNVVSSVSHIEITPSDMGNQDRVVIQDLLKEIAQTQQVDVSSKKRFKVVVINEADSLTRDAQSALRRTMEKYTPNLRLILLANTTSNIIGPIRSRTLLVRVGAPEHTDIARVLARVAEKEKVALPDAADKQTEIFHNISAASNRNLRKALLIFEAMYAQNDKIDANTPIPPPDWEFVINKLADDIVAQHSVSRLIAARTTFYELLSHCIPAQVILKTLAFALFARVKGAASADVIEFAAMFDHRLKLGNKAIFHLEAFTAKVMRRLEE